MPVNHEKRHHSPPKRSKCLCTHFYIHGGKLSKLTGTQSCQPRRELNLKMWSHTSYMQIFELVPLGEFHSYCAILMHLVRGLRISSESLFLHQGYHTNIFNRDIYMLCIVSALEIRAQSLHISAEPSDVMSYGTIGMLISYSPKKNKEEV